MRTISIVSQKGGCGKTTTAVNVAAAFAELGKRVLLIDLDPQAHVTLGLGRNPDSCTQTVYDVLKADNGLLRETVVATGTPRLDLIPCNMLLAGAEWELAATPGRESLLHRALQSVRDTYDLCVIDCPPSLGLLTLNALAASTDVIIPVQVQYYALEALKRLLETIPIVRDRLHLNAVEHVGLLLTFVDERAAFCRQVERQVRRTFGRIVFSTVIHRDARLAEAPGAGQSILTYAPRSRGAIDYQTVAREILDGRPDVEEPPADRLPTKLPKRLAAIFSRPRIPRSAPLRRGFPLGMIETT